MKVYEITIKPLTGFGTPLKGDTIFGHFCWQIAYNEGIFGKPLSDFLSSYYTNPFAIFSSAYPKICVGNKYHYAFKAPALPPDELYHLPEDKGEKIERRKEYKAKGWMIVKEKEKFLSLKELDFLNDKELLEKANTLISDEARKQLRRSGAKNFIAFFSQPHNTINRLTSTTGEGGFAPFVVEQQVFYPETELALFVGIDESVISIDQIKLGLEMIGCTGFGKDASTGLGRFELGEEGKVCLSDLGSDSPNACYTLAPCVPDKDIFTEMFFTPFTRYGRHGDVLAKSSNPFKNPVIMADEGAIFIPNSQEVFSKFYIGKAISNISKTQPKTVMQGYSLYIPVRVEV